MIFLSNSPERFVAFKINPESKIDSSETMSVSSPKGNGSGLKIIHDPHHTMWKTMNQGEPKLSAAQSEIRWNCFNYY